MLGDVLASDSHISRRRYELLLDAGRAEGGYRSKRINRSSVINWREATSPGRLSEYSSEVSCTKGVGHELLRAKQPMADVDKALKHRSSS